MRDIRGSGSIEYLAVMATLSLVLAPAFTGLGTAIKTDIAGSSEAGMLSAHGVSSGAVSSGPQAAEAPEKLSPEELEALDPFSGVGHSAADVDGDEAVEGDGTVTDGSPIPPPKVGPPRAIVGTHTPQDVIDATGDVQYVNAEVLDAIEPDPGFLAKVWGTITGAVSAVWNGITGFFGGLFGGDGGVGGDNELAPGPLNTPDFGTKEVAADPTSADESGDDANDEDDAQSGETTFLYEESNPDTDNKPNSSSQGLQVSVGAQAARSNQAAQSNEMEIEREETVQALEDIGADDVTPEELLQGDDFGDPPTDVAELMDEVGAVVDDVAAEQTATSIVDLDDPYMDKMRLIRDVAQSRGIDNGYLLAGIASAETQLAHCWSELTWACKGPASASCGGGPVVAGAGDGPCSRRQGGLGMFQFDAGTYDDTLRREGKRVLTLEGNVDASVDFVLNMVRRSAHIQGVNSEAEALEWINRVSPDDSTWDQWITTVTHYYNGCAPSMSCHFERRRRYGDHTRDVYNTVGPQFWRERPMSIESNIRFGDGVVSRGPFRTGSTALAGSSMPLLKDR